MPKLSSDQQQIVAEINRAAVKVPRKLRRKFKLSAVEMGIVESGLRNLNYGDADSKGWRQERTSIYGPSATNVKASVRRFRDEFLQHYDPGETAGEVAAQVQRPREDLRGRYQQAKPQARRILAEYGGGLVKDGASSFTSGPAYSTRTIPGVDNGPLRQQLKLQYLSQSHDPNALLQLATGLKDAQDTPDRTVTTTRRVRQSAVPTEIGNGAVGVLKAAAEEIDAARVPYQWGGGHGGKQKRGSKVTPLDCSGAVSRVLGIDPKVSGQFESWGKSGKGTRVTVYANGEHVLMELDGHFFGTSGSNPGGGAGWIKRKHISKDYLRGFTARHPPGM